MFVVCQVNVLLFLFFPADRNETFLNLKIKIFAHS